MLNRKIVFIRPKLSMADDGNYRQVHINLGFFKTVFRVLLMSFLVLAKALYGRWWQLQASAHLGFPNCFQASLYVF